MTRTSGNPLCELNEKQLRALDALANGGTHADAATAAGVHRVTVTKWSNSHPGFLAERNRRRSEMSSALADKAARIDAAALDQMLELVMAGNQEAIALWVRQRNIGSISADTSAPVTPSGIVQALVDQRRQERRDEQDRRTLAGILDDGCDDADVPIDDDELRREIVAELIAALDGDDVAPGTPASAPLEAKKARRSAPAGNQT